VYAYTPRASTRGVFVFIGKKEVSMTLSIKHSKEESAVIDTHGCIAKEHVKGGDIMIDGLVLDHRKNGSLNSIADILSPYSHQEIMVAELSAEGKSDREIARILKVDPQHIVELRANIIAKARSCMRGC
jgi:hypothetical protein